MPVNANQTSMRLQSNQRVAHTVLQDECLASRSPKQPSKTSSMIIALYPPCAFRRSRPCGNSSSFCENAAYLPYYIP